MPSQVSVAVSDALLSLTTLNAAYRVSGVSLVTALGFLLIATAAGCGVIRFSLPDPSTDIIAWHKHFSWLSSAVGVPFVAAGYCREANIVVVSHALTAGGIALALLQKYFNDQAIQTFSTVIAGCSLASIICVSIPQFNEFGIIGGILYLVAGLVVGTEGSIWGILKVDIFHVMLTLGNVSLMKGLLQEVKPIYYRPVTS